MKLLQFLLIFFTTVINAQIITIKVTDYKTNTPLKNADVYFMHSTKNYVTDVEGYVTVDLKNVTAADDLFVAKKEYQNVKISVSKLYKNLNVQLEKVKEIELGEAFFTNLKIEDILRIVIDNYETNYNVDKYYFLVDLKQDFKIDTLYRNSINLNLQLKFNKGKIKAKTSGIVKKRLIEGKAPIKLSFNQSDYFKHLYILDGIKSTYERVKQEKYKSSKLSISEYADKKMYEILLVNDEDDKNYFLIDKETFSVVEYALTINNVISTNKNEPLERIGNISLKYRPYIDTWVLKESEVTFKMNLKQKNNKNLNIDFIHKISTWNFSEKRFQFFNKNLDLDENLHDSF